MEQTLLSMNNRNGVIFFLLAVVLLVIPLGMLLALWQILKIADIRIDVIRK